MYTLFFVEKWLEVFHRTRPKCFTYSLGYVDTREF